ncbi:MAG: tetratricopeptide repeat protein [Proteobacteria bacterium]|nr:tetratricopeptide repeat protein [Pseudomonadota bacterium]
MSFTFTANAFAAAYDEFMTIGKAKLEDKQYSFAESAFRSALNERPDDHEATLHLGIALNRMEGSEAESILKRALYLDPEDPRANFELAIHYLKRSIKAEAREFFDTVVRLAPGTELAERAEKQLDEIRGKVASGKAARRWAILTSAGLQYDSNVILISDGAPFPGGVSRKSDWRGLFCFSGAYSFLRKDKFRSSVGYSLYQSIHKDLSEYNVNVQNATFVGSYAIRNGVTLKGLYSFGLTYIGGDQYSYTHKISPSIEISEGNGFDTTIFYRLGDTNFQDSNRFSNNSDRTGSTHVGGIIWKIPIASDISGEAGYSYEAASARKQYWEYKGDRGFLDLLFKLPRDVAAKIHSEYLRKDYKGSNPFSGGEREDRALTLSLSLTKRLSTRMDVSFSQAFVDNDSNVKEYDYKRSISSLSLKGRF